MSEDLSNYSIIENGLNTEKNPEDLKGLAVTQKPSTKTDVKNSTGVNNNQSHNKRIQQIRTEGL